MPFRLFPQQKLEVHAEVLHLFSLLFFHDPFCFVIGFNRHALFIPVNRLRFFDKPLHHAGECSGLGR